MTAPLSVLTEEEIRFLQKIQSQELCLLRDNKASPGIQKLIDRGYCRTAKTRSGPLGVFTGEIGILVTEAGQSILQQCEQKSIDLWVARDTSESCHRPGMCVLFTKKPEMHRDGKWSDSGSFRVDEATSWVPNLLGLEKGEVAAARLAVLPRDESQA